MQVIDRYNAAKRKIMEREFSRMNDRQREAVFATEGPVLILAGAGSGKTTVLINRAANLLKYGRAYQSTDMPLGVSDDDVDLLERYADDPDAADAERVTQLISCDAPQPWQLMAITFTNKAAGELKQRLCDMLGESGNEVWAATFHSSCARILRRYGDRLGYSSHFTIYDTDDQKRVIKSVMGELNIDEKRLKQKDVITEISHAKEAMQPPEEYAAKVTSDFRIKQISQIYTLYQKRLRESDAMDFDDLLYNTVRLLEDDEEVRGYFQRRFRYIMVDEYQDTNHAQYRMIKMLAGGHRNLCVVGDDDQSIYKFRGATIENILSFEKTYPNARVIRLEQNYRSTQRILDAANSVIKNNTGRHAKQLWTSNGTGDKITVYTASDERTEAEYIAKVINDHAADGGKYSDCAVLYRASALSNTIENYLMRAGIPYRVLAGRKFYDRKEIRDAIAYLSVINNPADEVRLTRIINEPKRGIGEKTVQNASEIAAQLGVSMFEVLCNADQYAALSRSASKLKPFCDMMRGFIEAADDPSVDLGWLLDSVLEESGYIDAMLENDDKAQERIENLHELSSTLMRYQDDNGEEATLGGYLEDVALITDIDGYDTDADCAVLMTLHAAKGLEFPVVVIAGAEEGIFPNMMTMLDPAEVEEDRRLAYVGITRAKRKLYITHAAGRILYGQTQRNKLSRYITEIDSSLVERKGVAMHAVVNRDDDYTPRSLAYAHEASTTTVREQHISNVDKSSSSAPKFAAGDRVKHRVFGEGTVLTATPMGNDILLVIDFPKVGQKKLMANFAGLKKL